MLNDIDSRLAGFLDETVSFDRSVVARCQDTFKSEALVRLT
jgi:hypothetical protein